MDSKEEALKRKKALEEANKKRIFETEVTKKPLSKIEVEKAKKEVEKAKKEVEKAKKEVEKAKKESEKAKKEAEKQIESEVKTLKTKLREKETEIEQEKEKLTQKKKKSKYWKWILIAGLIVFVYVNFFRNTEQYVSNLENVSDKTSTPSVSLEPGAQKTTSTSTTLQEIENPFSTENFNGEAQQVYYEEDWPALYSIELVSAGTNNVEILVESRNLYKFRYILYNGCEYSYTSGQMTYNKEIKKLLPSKDCLSEEFDPLLNTYSSARIILESKSHNIEIKLTDSSVIFPNNNNSFDRYCCTTLTFYPIHPAINNTLITYLRDSESSTSSNYKVYPSCKENVDRSIEIFKYYEEDISNQFNSWNMNIRKFSSPVTEKDIDQYFNDKNKVSEMLIYADNIVDLLPIPEDDSLYDRYYSYLIQVKNYAEEYFETYELFYEQGSISSSEASIRYDSIVDKWVNVEIRFAQLDSCN